MTKTVEYPYKALMLDCDGTIVPYDYHALPSLRVTSAIRKAQDVLTVCLATGRSYHFAKPILDHLHMNEGLAILNDGAQVIDLATKQPIYEQTISHDDLDEIRKTLKKRVIPYYIHDETRDYQPHEVDHYNPNKVFNIFTVEELNLHTAQSLVQDFSHFKSLVAHKIQHADPEKYGLLISPVLATKQHGIAAVSKHLGIDTHEIIGVGDGYNDFPLLMACGLRIAMGNAVPELKEIADIVAPSVDEDGLADVIEKFVLTPTPSLQAA